MQTATRLSSKQLEGLLADSEGSLKIDEHGRLSSREEKPKQPSTTRPEQKPAVRAELPAERWD